MRLTQDNFGYPKRVTQHISETASGRIFQNATPDKWLIRGISERDYGIDYYLELVDDNDQMTGKLTLIQVKARQGINWTKKNTNAISDVAISTSNYLAGFAVPSFLFVVDTISEEIYFLPIKKFIRENYLEYLQQKQFTYHIDKFTQYDSTNGHLKFLKHYEQEVEREQFETTITSFLSNVASYCNFIREHNNLDHHLGLEDDEIVMAQGIVDTYQFLAKYLSVGHNLPSFTDLKKQSKGIFGDTYYELYEHDLTRISEELEELTLKIVEACVDLIENENQFWMHQNRSLFNFATNLNPDQLFY